MRHGGVGHSGVEAWKEVKGNHEVNLEGDLEKNLEGEFESKYFDRITHHHEAHR